MGTVSAGLIFDLENLSSTCNYRLITVSFRNWAEGGHNGNMNFGSCEGGHSSL